LAKGEYHEKSVDRLPWWMALLVPGVFALVIILVVVAWRQSVKGYARANNQTIYETADKIINRRITL